MNPRPGQFALGGTLSGWTRLERPTATQSKVLRRCYAGLEPRTYSRYGASRASAPWPWAHTIIKDPFALLSVPTIAQVTGAVPVVVYRHPGAVLASYRRMGWTADVEEMRTLRGLDAAAPDNDAAAMVEFWSFLHECVLEWLHRVPTAVLVSHAELTLGGDRAVRAVMHACGLVPGSHGDHEPSVGAPEQPRIGQLHGFDRAPGEVASGWRERLDPNEVEHVEVSTSEIWQRLESERLELR